MYLQPILLRFAEDCTVTIRYSGEILQASSNFRQPDVSFFLHCLFRVYIYLIQYCSYGTVKTVPRHKSKKSLYDLKKY